MRWRRRLWRALRRTADEADLVDLVPQFAPETLAQKRLLVDNPGKASGANNRTVEAS